MASGIINLGTDNHLTGQILWTATPNGTEANTSTIEVTLQVARAYGSQYTTGGTFTGSVTIGAATQSFSEYEEVSTKWVTLFTYTEIKAHNSDGTGTCVIGATIKGPKGTTMEGRSVSASETVTLDTIPRGAVITSAPNFTDEENPTITYSNPAGNTVTALEACISLDSSNDEVAYRSISKTGTSYTFNLTEAERNVLRAATTDGNTRTVIFYIRTTIGSSLLYSTSSRTFTVTGSNPTINPSVTDNNNTTYNLTGNRNTLVKYYSNAAVTIGAAAAKGATLVSQKVTCGNKSLTANGTINAVESGTFVFTATDSRGNTTTKTVTQPFVEYIKLTCDLANNVPDGTGTMAVRISGNYFNSSFGSRNNSLTVYYRYKKSGGSFGNWTRINATISGNTYSATANVTGLDYRAAYVFEAYAVDALATVYSASKTVKSTPVFDWGENDFAFNVPVSMNGNRISGLAAPTNSSDAITLEYANSAFAPAGYGLGSTYGQMCSDCNDAVLAGMYTMAGSGCANYPSRYSNFAYGVLEVTARYGDVYQRISYRGYVATRHSIRNEGNISNVASWADWEYVNPPMEIGVEYRTTERYLGKVVYAMVFSFGILPNTNTKSVSVPAPASGASYVVSATAVTTAGALLNIVDSASGYTVWVKTSGDYSTTNANIIIKYTKD